MISPKQIDRFRLAGLRPEVVACIINEGKVLIAHFRTKGLWFFPQGGIDNKETTEQALHREMREELGKTFQKNLYGKPELIHTDKIVSSYLAGSRDLKTDDGKPVYMKGKYFFFFVIRSKTQQINIKDTEFDRIVWVPEDKFHVVSRLIPFPTKKKQFNDVSEKLKKYLR